MLLIAFAKAKAVAQKDRLARRVAWKNPNDVKVLHEFWPVGSQYAAVFVVEVDDLAPVLEVQSAWDDVFDVDIHPVLTADQGLHLAERLVRA